MKVKFLHAAFAVKMLQQKVRAVGGQFAFGSSGEGCTSCDCWEIRSIAREWKPDGQIWEGKKSGAESNIDKDEKAKRLMRGYI